MSIPRKLAPKVISVGAIDWDREIFDELVPLPDGTSYNAYIVQDSEKTVLIDTVDPTKVDVLIENLDSIDGLDNIDYIVANHAEQDHSGVIPLILEMYPDAKVLCSEKCKPMLETHLFLEPDQIVTVKDCEEISLGDRTLRFIYTPWVHWPETMSTYLVEDKILFSCDFFGSHLATSHLFATGVEHVVQDAKRYYAEIMMPFRSVISKNMDKIMDLDISMIAPSHGPVYDNPDMILDAYREWISTDVKNVVVLPFISMHESTRMMVDYLIDALMDRGITVKPFNLASADIGELAMSLVDAATIVLGSPTVLAGAHPKVAYAAILANALRPKTKFASIIGSYGWGGKMLEQLTGMISNLKVELLEPVVTKGIPDEEALKGLDRLADEILEKHRSLGIAE